MSPNVARALSLSCLLSCLLAPAPQGEAATFKPLDSSQIQGVKLYELGVADANDDGLLDVFTANHKFDSSLLAGDSMGGFTDVFTQSGLSPTPEFPGYEDLHREPDRSAPGLYLYATDRDQPRDPFHVATTAVAAAPIDVVWARVADIRAAVAVPVIANGEIWTLADALRCQHESGGTALMLGRGAVADPGLALAIRAHANGLAHGSVAEPNWSSDGLTWDELLPLITAFWQIVRTRLEPRAQAGRLKQWLNFLRRRHPGNGQHRRARCAHTPGGEYIEPSADFRALHFALPRCPHRTKVILPSAERELPCMLTGAVSSHL